MAGTAGVRKAGTGEFPLRSSWRSCLFMVKDRTQTIERMAPLGRGEGFVDATALGEAGKARSERTHLNH